MEAAPEINRADHEPANREQSAVWNGCAGRAWVDEQALLDRVFQPFEDLLVAEVARAGARRVLDVGCGSGATTLAISRHLGARGHCVGVDISEPLIDAARVRAQREALPAGFLLADAQVHAFEKEGFDIIVSRFGVMFFEDPVAAFRNLRQAVRAAGEMRCIAFRSPAENPFMTAAERAAAPFLPDLPPRRVNAPGQFAFADARRVGAILEAAGWAGIELRPIDCLCEFPVAELNRYLTRLGPVGLILQQADEQTRVRVLEAVRAAFEPFVSGESVRFDAACWMLAARAPGSRGRGQPVPPTVSPSTRSVG